MQILDENERLVSSWASGGLATMVVARCVITAAVAGYCAAATSEVIEIVLVLGVLDLEFRFEKFR